MRLPPLDPCPRTSGARMFWPIVNMGFFARVRYGVDLRRASPERVIRDTRIPVLLIHGQMDNNIPIRHSRELCAANRDMVCLWEVPGAGHAGSLGTAPEAYVKKVLDWFRSHR